MTDSEMNYLRLTRRNVASDNTFRINSEEFEEIDKHFPFKISEYCKSLIDWEDENCPVKKQFLLRNFELGTWNNEDGSNDKHKYLHCKCLYHSDETAYRAIIILTKNCFANCRFCGRKWIHNDCCIDTSANNIERAVKYLEDNKNITELIVSGGDPFTLPFTFLYRFLDSIKKIKHIEMIRISSRVLFLNPEIINSSVCEKLKEYMPFIFMSHFNNIKEITSASVNAVSLLEAAGIPIVNRTVLLSGINNSVPSLKALFYKLMQIGIKPYYIYSYKNIPIECFRIPFPEAMMLMDEVKRVSMPVMLPLYIIENTESYKTKLLFN